MCNNCGCAPVGDCTRILINSQQLQDLTYVSGIGENGCVAYQLVSDFLPSSFVETPLVPVDSATIDFTASGISDHTLTATVKISADDNNCIEPRADGIYMACPIIPESTVQVSAPITGDGSAGSPLGIDLCAFTIPAGTIDQNVGLDTAGCIVSGPVADTTINTQSPITGDGSAANPISLDICAIAAPLGTPVTVMGFDTDGCVVQGPAPTSGVQVSAPIIGDGSAGSPLGIDLCAFTIPAGVPLLMMGTDPFGCIITATPSFGVTVPAASGGPFASPISIGANQTLEFDWVSGSGISITPTSAANGIELLFDWDCTALANCSIGDIGNVQITTPVSGELMGFDGTNWVNVGAPTFTSQPFNVAGQNGVSVFTVNDTETLQFEGVGTPVNVTFDAANKRVRIHSRMYDGNGAPGVLQPDNDDDTIAIYLDKDNNNFYVWDGDTKDWIFVGPCCPQLWSSAGGATQPTGPAPVGPTLAIDTDTGQITHYNPGGGAWVALATGIHNRAWGTGDAQKSNADDVLVVDPIFHTGTVTVGDVDSNHNPNAAFSVINGTGNGSATIGSNNMDLTAANRSLGVGAGHTLGTLVFAAGANHVATGTFSSVSGGNSNEALANGSAVNGGETNIANGVNSGISSGRDNQNNAGTSQIASGVLNRINGNGQSFVGAGENNVLNADRSGLVAGYNNTVDGTSNFLGAGHDHTVGDVSNSFVGSGVENQIQDNTVGDTSNSFVGSGFQNVISDHHAGIVSGYQNNVADGGSYGAISGGRENLVSASYGTVPGGLRNQVTAENGSVLGRDGQSNHIGAFVFSDVDTGANAFASTANNEVAMRARGGYRLFTNASLTTGVTMASGTSAWVAVSDSSTKRDFVPVDGSAILEKIKNLAINTYRTKTNDRQTHIGPNADEFNDVFGDVITPKKVGDLNGLSHQDVDGVLLASVKALIAKVEDLTAQVAELKGVAA